MENDVIFGFKSSTKHWGKKNRKSIERSRKFHDPGRVFDRKLRKSYNMNVDLVEQVTMRALKVSKVAATVEQIYLL